MITASLNLVLVDDDEDDCLFFKEALEELPVSANLTVLNNGEELMQLLRKRPDQLPDVLFLDLNMPRKNGFECLLEIKNNEQLKVLPVVIFSTTFEKDLVNMLYQNGAEFYFRKPADFAAINQIILQVLIAVMGETILQAN